MKKILVPVDFSTNSSYAMQYALEIATKTKAQITVFHTLYPNQGTEATAYDALWVDEYFKRREKDLKAWVQGYTQQPKYGDISIGTEMMMGFPTPLICSKAEDENFDLIVIGAIGSTNLMGTLGSITAGVISRSKVPVVCVPQKSSLQEGSNIVLATDFTFKFPESTFSVLKDVLKMQDAKLKIVNVANPNVKKDIEKHKQELSERLIDFKHDFHTLTDTNVIRAISIFMEAMDASALFVVHHDHSFIFNLFFTSHSETLAKKAKKPVFVLPDTF